MEVFYWCTYGGCDSRGKSKKERRCRTCIKKGSSAIAAADLMEKIRGCNCDAIFDIETVLELPFPSLMKAPNRFQCNENNNFCYQARSDLKSLHDKVVDFWFKGKADITVNVAATIGYGKSYMLAVLVLLLLKNPIENRYGSMPFVCYIPDCRKLLAGEFAVVTILRQNILLNMPDFAGPLDTIEDIRAAIWGQSVILVADQWNSLDDGDLQCQTAINQLGSCLGTVYITIHGMSISKTFRKLLPKQTSDINNIYHGGLSDDEFGVWLEHHPAIFTDHEDELSLLTGKVPLLLSVFARVYDNGDSWESVVQRAQQDAIVEDWMVLLMKFYEEHGVDEVWKVYTLSVDWLLESKIVDFRFFYQDVKLGFCATSEIVMRLLYRVWSKKSADDALLKRWHSLVARNPSSCGFNVEEIIKAQICCFGVAGTYPLPKDGVIKRHRFKPGTEQSTLDRAMMECKANSWWILLDPEMFNYPGVDMILITETAIIGNHFSTSGDHLQNR